MPDLLLIVDHERDSLAGLRSVAERLGCDRIECDSSESLNDILAVRTPTLAVLALDTPVSYVGKSAGEPASYVHRRYLGGCDAP